MTLILSGTDGLSDIDGTAATPAIRGTDANTGIFFPAADTIAFSEGGAEAMRIDSSGNVGIGTTSPNAKLQVSSSTDFGAVLKVSDTSSESTGFVVLGNGNSTDKAVGIWRGAANSVSSSGTFLNLGGYGGMAFSTGAALLGSQTERMRLDTSGNLLFNSGYGSVATAYGCRAWVNFNGTGTVAIRASGNVTSITDNGTGSYTMNFTTAMPDTDYCCTMNGRTGGGAQSIITVNRDASPTTTTNPIYVVNPSTPAVLQDEAFCMVAVFR